MVGPVSTEAILHFRRDPIEVSTHGGPCDAALVGGPRRRCRGTPPSARWGIPVARPTDRLGSSEKLRIGQRTFVIGNPYGLGFGLSTGIISGIDRTPPTLDFMMPRVSLLHTTAPINPGDSGGSLVDSNGHVAGITTALLASTQHIGFAIPINLVKEVVTELKATGRVQRPWIGVAGKFTTGDIRELFVVPLTDGLLVETVAPDSPASHAGLQAGTVEVVVSG